jgi:hypothetical protein
LRPTLPSSAAPPAQIRDLKDELRLLRGAPERGPLTPDELARLEARVRDFVAAASGGGGSPGSGGGGGGGGGGEEEEGGGGGADAAALTAGGDLLAIRACEWQGGRHRAAGRRGARAPAEALAPARPGRCCCDC